MGNERWRARRRRDRRSGGRLGGRRMAGLVSTRGPPAARRRVATPHERARVLTPPGRSADGPDRRVRRVRGAAREVDRGAYGRAGGRELRAAERPVRRTGRRGLQHIGLPGLLPGDERVLSVRAVRGTLPLHDSVVLGDFAERAWATAERRRVDAVAVAAVA